MSFATPTPVTNQVDRFVKIRTPLRKSLNASFVSEPSNQDDDSERHKRRSMAHLQKKMASGPSTANTSIMESPMAGPDEIIDHIDVCLKMFFENKINSKNAWSIRIIDYMGKYLQMGKGNRDSLQLGSTSLDVGAKVYGIRVDDVHSAGLKLASDMSKVAHKERQEENNENGDDGGELNNTRKKCTTKKKKKFMLGGPKHTIAKDVNTLLADVPKLDSAFFQTNTNSDLSMVDNFLTNRISMNKSGYAFTLMSKEKLWTSSDNDLTLLDTQHPFNKPTDNTLNLCPEFQFFKVDEWDPDNEDIPRCNDTTHNTDVVFDDKGIPIAELDGPVHDIFEAAEPMDSDDEHLPEEIAVLGEVANIQDLRPTTLTEADDYSFRPILSSGKCITNIWAGPSHWKFKYLQRAGSRFSGAVVKQAPQKKKPKEKDSTLINFLDGAPAVDENCTKNRAKNTLKPWPETNRFRMPINTTHILRQIHSMFLKPSITLSERSFKEPNNNEATDQSDSDEISPYPYDNANDSFYCAQNGADDNGDDIVHEEDLAIAGQNQPYTGENLIDLPEMVETNYINYATRSKKMDMKKLKEKVWSVMVDKPDQDLPIDELYNLKIEDQTTFKDIYKTLPNVLNKSMKEELSSPLAFIAILHLANEQNLKLEGQPDLKDFTIKQDPGDPA